MQLTENILAWYKANARILPWRTDYQAYHVLISEVMLQQTQMERGLIYFNNWIAQFPTIFDVANASEEVILKAWEGLGYYRRARYLHDTAKKIAKDYNGIIPDNPDILATFKGLGDYTIAAICSLAYNKPLVSIDANVERVYSRLFCIEGYVKIAPAKGKIKELAYTYLPADNARMYNQALMELGALICKKKPLCELCPLTDYCKAYKENKQAIFPNPAPKAQIIKEDRIELILFTKDNKILIKQRDKKLHWGGLFEFYTLNSINIKLNSHNKVIKADLATKSILAKRIVKNCKIPYVYTNHKNSLLFYSIYLEENSKKLLEILPDFIAIEKENLAKYAFPSPHCKAVDIIFKEIN